MEAKLIMNNILTLTKNLSGILYQGTSETSNENIHNVFHTNLNECIELQKEIFDFMMQRGWYKQDQVEQQKIEQAKNKYSSN